MLRVVVPERAERHLGGRRIADVEVSIGDSAGQRIGRRTAGQSRAFGESGIGGDDTRRPRNVLDPFCGRATGRSPGRVGNLGRLQLDGDGFPARRFDEHRYRDDRIGELLVRLRIQQIGELQRKYIGDDLLRIGRQLHARQEVDRALTVDDRLRAGLIDGRDRRQRGLVVQDVGTCGAVGLDQHLEFRRRRAALTRYHEVDFDQHRSAADAHGRDRRVDLHVALFGGRAGDEGDRTLHQADQRRIVRPGRVVDHFVQHHLGVRREAEHAAVDKGDAERRIGAGLDHVAFVDVVAVVQNDRNAVADRCRGADQFGDMADDLGHARTAVGLRELGVSG